MRWPPAGAADWSDAVVDAGRDWSAWVEDRRGSAPGLLVEEWSVVLERADLPLEDLAEGRDWRVCEALLTLHAIADEACAGLGSASARADGRGARISRSSAGVAGQDGIAGSIPAAARAGAAEDPYAADRPSVVRTLRLRAGSRDSKPPGTRCRPVTPGPTRGRSSSTSCCCHGRCGSASPTFVPWRDRCRGWSATRSDSSSSRPPNGSTWTSVDRVLTAARDEVDERRCRRVARERRRCERDRRARGCPGPPRRGLSHGRGPSALTASRGGSGENWVHTGVNPRLGKGGGPPDGPGQQWFHIRQNKHHRWSLDESQIYQYHLGGALHPHVRWWEAMEVPRRSVQFVTLGEEITIVSLVCEDLAENDQVAEVIRAVGPTGVITVLLDGPQLTSRWAARYASVLADDPGSAVLTADLVRDGAAQPAAGRLDASTIVALWKDPEPGFREIPLESGAQAVLLTACGSRATRRTGDGRRPVDTGTHSSMLAVHQIRASDAGSRLLVGRRRGELAPSPRRRRPHGPDRVGGGGGGNPCARSRAHPRTAGRCAPGRCLAIRARDRRPLPEARQGDRVAQRSDQAAAPADGPPSFDAALAASREDRVRRAAARRTRRLRPSSNP